MNDLPRGKYEILDLIFTFFNALCMVLSAILLLNNLIVAIIYVSIIVLIAFVVLFLWISRNPFNIYLVRAFAFNNLFFTFIALMIFYSLLSPITTAPVGYALLLLPSIFYLIFSFKYSAITLTKDKRAGLMLAYAGRSKAARRLFIKDNPEEGIKREELIAKQKKVYRYKIIIALVIVLTLSSFYALSSGFY